LRGTEVGGKKKQTLKKTERAQKKKPSKKEKKTSGALREKTAVPRLTPPNMKNENFVNELKKMKVITPFSVASRYELRLSIAREFLRELERNGLIRFVSRSRNLRIYTPVD